MKFSGRIDPKRFPAYQDIARLSIERCLAPGEACGRPTIRAHSVQRARFLKLLASKGHVMAVKYNSTPANGLVVDFERVGLSRATTFTGLCSEHDDALFAPIEKNELQLDNPEHLFLLAYRSLLLELHQQLESASKVQSAYLYRVRHGLDPSDASSRAGIIATHRMMCAYDTHQYKLELDAAYLARDYGGLNHHVVSVDVQRPTVAGSAFFSVDDVYVGDETLGIHLNMLPMSTHRTVAVFSYPKRFGRAARRYLRPMLRRDDRSRLHDLSRLVIDSCGDLVVSPEFVDSWSDEKRDAIVRYYVRTALDPITKYDSPFFDLFVAPAQPALPADSGTR